MSGAAGWRATGRVCGPDGSVRALALGVLVFLCYPALEMASGRMAAGPLVATSVSTVVVVGLYLWVVWHRRSPDRGARPAALAAMVAAGVIVPAVWGPTWIGLLLFPAVAAAMTLPAAAGVLTSAGLAGLVAVEGAALGASGELLLSLGLVTVLSGLAAVGYLRLVETNDQLREARAEVARLAVSQERARMGRDLHDAVKQHLFVASMQLGTARAGLGTSPETAREHLDEAARALREAAAELSQVIQRTRPAEDEAAPMAAALRDCVATWSWRTGIHAEFSVEGTGKCPGEAAIAFARACQEALANVLRHAHATAVQVRLRAGEHVAELRIADNGTGFDPSHRPHGGHGLAIMRERLAGAGGAAEVHSAPGKGTEVLLRWPATPDQGPQP